MEKKYYVVEIRSLFVVKRIVAFESLEHAKGYVKNWGDSIKSKFAGNSRFAKIEIIEAKVPNIPIVNERSYCSFIDYSVFHDDCFCGYYGYKQLLEKAKNHFEKFVKDITSCPRRICGFFKSIIKNLKNEINETFGKKASSYEGVNPFVEFF